MSEDNPSTPAPDNVNAVQRTSPPPSPNAGPTPGVNIRQPREGTSSAVEEQVLSGPRLRSGTVLAGPPTKVSLSKFLDKLYEKARESDKLSTTHCDALDHRLSQNREQRLAQIENFKRDTETFKEELVKFAEFSRSLNLSDKDSARLSNSESARLSETDCESETGEQTVEGLLCNWLEASLTENSLEESTHSSRELNFRDNKPKFTMPNYAKVAKLTAQLVPLFSGENSRYLSQELQTFLGCCKQTQQCLAEDEQAAFLQILPTRLRGEAYQLFASDLPNTFQEIEDRLNRAYLPRETYQELVNKLITTRQFPLETLNNFTSRLKQLLALCKEAAETKYGLTAAPAVKAQLDDFAINALKSGVNNPHLCQYLLTLSEVSLDVLISKALDMERLQQSSLHIQPTVFQTTQPVSPNIAAIPSYTSGTVGPSVSKMSTIPFEQKLQPNFLQETQRSHPPYTATKSSHYTTPQDRSEIPIQSTPKTTHTPKSAVSRVTCRFCNNRGHTYDECLKRKNTPYCLNCKRDGHDIRDCRSNRLHSNTGQQRGPPNRPPQDSNNSTGPRVYNIRLKCDFCGRKGHSVQVCQQKIKWEKKSQGNDKQSTQKSPARL